MSWTNGKKEYQRIATSIEPTVTITDKNSWFWTFAWLFLVVVTLGMYAIAVNRETFLKRFAICIGPVQAYPKQWLALPTTIIVHECTHTLQCITAARFIPILGWIPWRKLKAYIGLLPMALVYFILPFPIIFCYGRYKLELNADIAAWKWALENKWSYPFEIIRKAKQRSETVGGNAYFFPWPKSWVRKGYEKSALKTIKKYWKE